MSGITNQSSSEPTVPRYELNPLLRATDTVSNSSSPGAEDPISAQYTLLFDELVRPDAYTTSSAPGWVPHLLESTIDPHSPSMLFHSGTAQDLPVTQSALALHQFNDGIFSLDPSSASAPFAWPSDTALSGASPASDHLSVIPQHYEHSIPYITDLVCPPATLPAPCPPGAFLDEGHGFPQVYASDGASAPAGTAAPSRTKTRAQRAYSPYPSSSASSSTSRPCSRASYTSNVSTSQRPRNIQVPRDIFRRVMETHTGWKCPFCPYVQTKQRSPDMKRHLATHCPEAALLRGSNPFDASKEYRCCGIPVEKASRYGLDVSKPAEFNGVRAVRGCGMTFSRHDALLRHVANANNTCLDERTLQKQARKPGSTRCTKKTGRRV